MKMNNKITFEVKSKIMNKKFIKKNIYILIFLFTFMNFNFNFLNIAGTNNFYNTPATNGEVETTDGILYGLKTDKYTLGRITRGEFRTWMNPEQYKNDFKERNDDGEFKQYVTAYGLQVKIFGNLVKYLNLTLKQMHIINSVIFSIIIVLFSIFLQKNFTFAASIIFALTLSMSPWIINHAKDVRFITWASFLPLLSISSINYFFNLKKLKNLIFCCSIIFLTILFKCLFGYEYISTIMIITFIYFIFVISKLKMPLNFFILSSIISSSFILLAFLVSFTFQNKLIAINENSTFEIIKTRIYMNLGLDISDELKNNPCLAKSSISKKNTKKKCKNDLQHYEKLEDISRLEVLGRYFIFRNLLPWVGNSETYLSEDFKNYLKTIFWEGNYSNIKIIFDKFNYKSFLAITLVFFQTLIFVVIVLYSFKKIFTKGDFAEKLLLVGSFIGSISWFIIAKNYSFVHMHLCYIAWYLSFLPFALALLTQSFKNEKKQSI